MNTDHEKYYKSVSNLLKICHVYHNLQSAKKECEWAIINVLIHTDTSRNLKSFLGNQEDQFQKNNIEKKVSEKIYNQS